MRRHVIVFDTGQPCNRFSHASHGFLTRDGVAPAELLQISRDQLTQYTTITLRSEAVTEIVPQTDSFRVETGTDSFSARKILLATGLRDELPPLRNIAQFWGRSVFHCPYCDGWEWRDQPLAIYGNGDFVLHMAKLVRNLTADLVVCTGEAATFSAADRQLLLANQIQIIETPVERLEGKGEQLESIVFADGARLARRALYVRPKLTQHADLAAQLGCIVTDAGFVQVDAMMRTSVAGIYAAGDMTTMFRQVLIAAAHGATAASALNLELSTEDFHRDR
jgi:thioredoxin reductase